MAEASFTSTTTEMVSITNHANPTKRPLSLNIILPSQNYASDAFLVAIGYFGFFIIIIF